MSAAPRLQARVTELEAENENLTFQLARANEALRLVQVSVAASLTYATGGTPS